MSMTADPHHRTMSLHLARTLDEIGLNTLTVKKRRHAYLCIEEYANVYECLIGYNTTSFHFGSQTEGTTTPGMSSDLDRLICDNDFNVIEDMNDWEQGKINLLMLQEDTTPGYCRLQLLRPDIPMARGYLPDKDFCYDERGRVIIKNTYFYSRIGIGFEINGPAQTSHGEAGVMDNDRVYAVRCKTWPIQAEEFIRRRRHHDWPSQQLLENATRHGVFLVPVGHKLSPTEPLEWRISASLAERFLMFSLNAVHIKCYFVLKLLIKSFVEPRIQKCISSYHCKTALLHCTENTEPCFWREDNLLPCVMKCLAMLRDWVTDLFCPQFMINKENLFAGKVTSGNRDLLLSILTELIESSGRVLLLVSIDNLGQKLQTYMNAKSSRVPQTELSIRARISCSCRIIKQSFLSYFIIRLAAYYDNGGDQLSVIRLVYRDIVKLQGMIEVTNKHGRRAINDYIATMSCWLGSLIASLSLAHNQKVPRKAVQMLCTTGIYDVSSLLKLASVFYCSGKFRKTEILLHAVEDIVNRNVFQVICGCYGHVHAMNREFFHKMYAPRCKKASTMVFAHCVRFSRHEIHCAPQALHHEMYRAANDAEHSDPGKYAWMGMAVVDCRPYFYYLQYLTYKRLGEQGLQKCSLRNLERCSIEDRVLYHNETAWNLLGQCWASEKKPTLAMASFLISLEIRQNNNAASRHLQDAGVTWTWKLAYGWYIKLVGKLLLVPLLAEMMATMMPLGTEPLLILPLLPIAKRCAVSNREMAYFMLYKRLNLHNTFM